MSISLLKCTHNTRDLGGYLCSDGALTKQLILLRSDAPKHMEDDDIQFLQKHSIRTVIDLRTTVNEPYQRMLESNGFEYRPCRISAGSSVPNSVDEVPVSYLAIAESDGIRDALRTIAASQSGVLFHCTAGKDRTGVLSAILLLHADVPDGTVIQDYTLTKEYGREILETVFRMFSDADKDIITPHPEHMKKFIKLFREKYQSTDIFMQRIGLSLNQRKAIRNKLRIGNLR